MTVAHRAIVPLTVILLALGATAAHAKNASQPPTRVTIAVPEDKRVEVVLGPRDSSNVIIYMHGVCGDPLAFSSWATAAAKRATLISLRGDVRCQNNRQRHKWSYDYKRNDRRIRAAIDAVERMRQNTASRTTVTPLDKASIILIGYSQGAKRAEALAYRFPARYRRVALIGIATKPNATMLLKSERVLLMAGAWDARRHIRAGRAELERARKSVRYLELPKARHGEYGPKALEVMDQGLGWLLAPPPEGDEVP